jgi:hypothetical protein
LQHAQAATVASLTRRSRGATARNRSASRLITSAGVITSSYVSANAANTSGTLFISGGGTMVAAIKMVGSYSVGDFHITSGAGGTVAITAPLVPNGGRVEPRVSDIT